MPNKYIGPEAIEMIGQVQNHMSDTVKMCPDLSTAIKLMYISWRDSVISEAIARGEKPPELKEFV